jgi:hypothetical protein
MRTLSFLYLSILAVLLLLLLLLLLLQIHLYNIYIYTKYTLYRVNYFHCISLKMQYIEDNFKEKNRDFMIYFALCVIIFFLRRTILKSTVVVSY